MPHEDHFDAGDGLTLMARCWQPSHQPRGAVVFVHGICEHGGRYAHLAEALCTRGFAVDLIDLRGHGKSSGEPILIRRFDDYLDDLELVLDRVRRRLPGLPLFLVGHSMGGAVVTRLAMTRQPAIDGLVLSAPSVRVAGNLFPILRHLASLCSYLLPRLRLVRMGSRTLSRDPQVVADFDGDPLVWHGKFPVRTGAEILRTARQIQAGAGQLNVPLLILHGTGDFVTDPGGSRLLYDHAASEDKTLKLYSGLYHDLFHEPEQAQIIGDVLGWLEAHTDGVA